MPTGTFFRLPEEKKTRLIDAAWKEFTRTKFSETSISCIVREAGIPRGSFYQYFADKEDVLDFLVGDIRVYFDHMLKQSLDENNGNLFRMPFAMFDKLVREDGEVDSGVRRCMELFQANPGMDLQNTFLRQTNMRFDACKLQERLDLSQLRTQDDNFVCQVFELVLKITASAVAMVLTGASGREQALQCLHTDLDIVQYGCLSAPCKDKDTI